MQNILKYKFYTTTLIPLVFILVFLLTHHYGGHILFHTNAEILSILFIVIFTMLIYTRKKKNFDAPIYYYVLTFYTKVDDSFTLFKRLNNFYVKIRQISAITGAFMKLFLLIFFFFTPSFLLGSNVPHVIIFETMKASTIQERTDGLISYMEEKGFVDGKTIKLHRINAQQNRNLGKKLLKETILKYPPALVITNATMASQIGNR